MLEITSLIGIKRCPKCKTIITSCVRYGNIIKKHFKDVLGIRKKIFGNGQSQKQTQEFIAKKIQHHSNKNSQFEYVREFLEKKLFVMKQIKINNFKQIDLHLLDVDQYTFESLNNIVIWWEEAEKNVKLNVIESNLPPHFRSMRGVENQELATKQDLTTDCRNELINMYNKLFRLLLAKKLPLSSHEIEDFEQEFTKVYDFYRLGLRRGIDKFDSFDDALDMYNSVHKHIAQNKPYDNDMQEMFEKLLLNLETIIKTGWESEKKKREKRETESRINRESIFTAMGFAGNHWYRCPKGHLYVVADCGALNQSGACPECGSTIGRGSQITNAVRDDAAIRQQINSVVDIFDEHSRPPPTFSDRSRNAGPSRPYSRGGRGRGRGRGRR